MGVQPILHLSIPLRDLAEARDEFDAVVARFAARGVKWVQPVSTEHEGPALEQTKAKIADPSGNVIEIKTYPDVASALEISAP